MKKYYIEIGMLLVAICVTVVLCITTPKSTNEYVFNDHVEETSYVAESLTRFVVANYDELANMDIGYEW